LVSPCRGNLTPLVADLDDVVEVVYAFNFELAQVLDNYTFGWVLQNLQALALVLAGAQ